MRLEDDETKCRYLKTFTSHVLGSPGLAPLVHGFAMSHFWKSDERSPDYLDF